MTDGARAGFAITVAFDLVEGGLSEFLRMVKENAALSVAQEAGCLRFDVLTPLDAGGTGVLLYEVYTDDEAYDQHLASEHFGTFNRHSRALVRSKTVTRFAVAIHEEERDPA